MKNNNIIIPLLICFIVLLLLILNIPKIKFGIPSSISSIPSSIPRIIHQTAPTDRSKWDDRWVECQQTWFGLFPEFEFKLWNDEDIDNLVMDNFPTFYENTYKNYDVKIKKIDASRYCMLYVYGGMYVDMDYKCFVNFWNDIPQDKISIVESPFKGEHLQNSLMISKPNEQFWISILDQCALHASEDVLDATGPRLLSSVYYKNSKLINVLPKEIYNPSEKTKTNNKMKARQLMTASWVPKK
jgi:mannosyltransferase OCH1-like enzyme